MRKITLVLGIAFLLQMSNKAVAAPFPLDSLRKQVESNASWELKKEALLSLTDHYQMYNSDSLFYYTKILRALGLEHDDPACLMHVSLVTGRSFSSKGELKEARRYYYEGLHLAKKHNIEKGIAWASLNLGLNHGRGYELDSAFYYVQEAEKYFIKTDLEEELWRCYLGFATIHKERRDFAAADADFRKAIDLYPDSAPTANRGFLLYRAFAYAAQFRRFDLLRDVRIMWDEYKGAKRFNISLLEKPEHIALYSLIAGEEIDMEKVIYDAIDYYKDSDRPQRLAWCYHDLGEIYYNNRNYELSKQAYEKADMLYTNAGYSSHIVFIRKRLAELYQREGNYLKALEYTNASYRVLDSLKNEESERNLRQFEVQYETEKKEQALIINQLELKQKTQERNIWLGSSVFLALLGLLVFGGLRQRLRQRELLANQEAALQEQRIQQLEQEKTLLAMSSMIEGQEQERQRIAKDLHDGMGGLLTTIKAHYSTLVSYFPIEEATEKIAPMTGELIDRACTEVRRISQNMMPAALLYSGLSGALEDLAVQVRTNRMECSLEIVGPIDRIDEIRTIALYRVVQEAVNNILKHARASHVLIQVIVHQDVVNATIEDDGSGFEIQEGLQKKSLGLRSMDSRVRYLKGTCDIDSVPGEGTTVSLQFPIE